MERFDLNTLLKENVYPGRGIIAGKTADGTKAVAAYFIMGRSSNSRNRIFVEEGQDLAIHPYDASLVEDPSLIIYHPIRVWGNHLIVTNGDQTDTIYDGLQKGSSFSQALRTRCFEPDAPNYTPRISALLTMENNDFTYSMSILKSADEAGSGCNRFTFDYAPTAGVGHFLHTYRGDGDPIPAFFGEPEPVVLEGDIEQMAGNIWNSLHSENKISLYVRFIDLHNGTIENRMYNKNR